MKSKFPPKIPDLLAKVRAAVLEGNYSDTVHSGERSDERTVSDAEIKQVLLTGWHEQQKDEFDSRYKNWKYAIRGKTATERSLRVIVIFAEKMVIVTVIDLDI